jgi:hypothetical protein
LAFAGGGSYSSTPGVNTGNGGSRQTRPGASGWVAVRYPSVYTLTIGDGLISSLSTIGSEKVNVFTAGTGTCSFTY